MNDWKEYKIGDLCETISDTYSGNDKEVVLINTSDVLDGRILNHQKVENKNLKGQFKKTFKKNDILYSEIRPANRRFAYVDIEDTSYYIASTKLMVLRANESLVEPKYLFAVLSSQPMITELQLLAESRSGTFPQITFSTELAPMRISIPDKETQRKIVYVIECYEKKILNNERIILNLKEQSQSLYKSWFFNFDEENGQLPESWKTGRLEDVADIKTTTFSPAKNPDTVVEHYSIPALDNNCLPVFEKAVEIKSNKYQVTKESVLISKLNPETKRIWRPFCLSNHPVCSTEFIVYEAKNKKHRDFIYSIIDSFEFSQFLCMNVTGTTGSRQRAIPKATIDFEITLPDDDTIDKFCSIVSPLYDLINYKYRENAYLLEVKNDFLPKFIAGEQDASNIELRY